jgi:hypothetical protein
MSDFENEEAGGGDGKVREAPIILSAVAERPVDEFEFLLSLKMPEGGGKGGKGL